MKGEWREEAGEREECRDNDLIQCSMTIAFLATLQRIIGLLTYGDMPAHEKETFKMNLKATLQCQTYLAGCVVCNVCFFIFSLTGQLTILIYIRRRINSGNGQEFGEVSGTGLRARGLGRAGDRGWVRAPTEEG